MNLNVKYKIYNKSIYMNVTNLMNGMTNAKLMLKKIKKLQLFF